MEFEPFVQSDSIRDYVFPLAEISIRGDGVGHMELFRGTGFFIGNRNFALTAGHVVKDVRHHLAAFLIQNDKWILFDVGQIAFHPTEDLAVISLEPPVPGNASTWRSIVDGVVPGRVHSADHYYIFGYPEDAAFELELDNEVLVRPDLVYSEGHVRRRLRGVPLRGIRGSTFLELSGVAGGGCSGSPMFHLPSPISFLQGGNVPRWNLTGIYVGERTNDRSTSVGYGIPLDEIGEWVPDVLGRSVVDEIVDN